MSIEVSRNITLRPSTSSFVVFLIFLGVPMVLAWFTIIHYGVTSGSSFLSLIILPALLVGLIAWLLGQRIIIHDDDLVYVRWFFASARLSKADIESVEIGIRLVIHDREGTVVSIPINIFPVESRRALRSFLEEN